LGRVFVNIKIKKFKKKDQVEITTPKKCVTRMQQVYKNSTIVSIGSSFCTGFSFNGLSLAYYPYVCKTICVH